MNLSIKNAPEEIVRRLKERARRNHRSLQGELLAIIEDVIRGPRALTPADVQAEVERLKLRTPAESTAMIRRDRDAR